MRRVRKKDVSYGKGRRDWKCLGENATCNGCLAHRQKWAGNSPEKAPGEVPAEQREEIDEKKKSV